MNKPEKSIELIFDPSTSFEERCSKIFQFQAENNPVYQRFIHAFGIQPSDRFHSLEIPLLPIRAFKDGKIHIQTEQKKPELLFKSSGTSEMERSRHYILNRHIYEKAILLEFKKYFPFEKYATAFYLPGYDENPESSLIWMAKHIINSDPTGESRFVSDLLTLNSNFNQKKKILLFGAAFGLMDMMETGELAPINNLEILETGGMKTHRREMSKLTLRKALSEGFQVPAGNIHSEYGMCELLSQMYAIGGEWFDTPHWVQVSVRDPKQPSRICEVGEEGNIGIIDFANIYSCPFILTEDRGVMDSDGRFRVLGRWHSDDLRGCNFLIDNE